jgi:predicted Co/Zn/Cd cation transporter (cation efflux family)
MTDNTGRQSRRHPDADGVPDEMTVEDVIVTPLDERDPYRLFWVSNQVILAVSFVFAVVAIITGIAVDGDSVWIAGMLSLIVSMLSVIGLLLARIGSDLKGANVM